MNRISTHSREVLVLVSDIVFYYVPDADDEHDEEPGLEEIVEDSVRTLQSYGIDAQPVVDGAKYIYTEADKVGNHWLSMTLLKVKHLELLAGCLAQLVDQGSSHQCQ